MFAFCVVLCYTIAVCGFRSGFNYCRYAFLKQSVREQAIPFEIKRNVPNAETIAAVDEFYETKTHPEK